MTPLSLFFREVAPLPDCFSFWVDFGKFRTRTQGMCWVRNDEAVARKEQNQQWNLKWALKDRGTEARLLDFIFPVEQIT